MSKPEPSEAMLLFVQRCIDYGDKRAVEYGISSEDLACEGDAALREAYQRGLDTGAPLNLVSRAEKAEAEVEELKKEIEELKVTVEWGSGCSED